MASPDQLSQFNKLMKNMISLELLPTLLSLLLLSTLCSARSVTIDDTQLLLKEWKDACSTSSGSPVLSVPEGKTMKLRPVTLSGPCKSSIIRFNVMGTIVGPADTAAWGSNPSLITLENVNGITIDGTGTIDGQGSSWWNCKNKGKGGCRGVPNTVDTLSSPCNNLRDSRFESGGLCHGLKWTMRISGCSRVKMTGIKLMNPPNMHLGILDCQDVGISQVSITAPANSPNTDGIHLQRSQHVRITNCNIATGDDCVSVGTGTSNVNISDVTCGPGHGISIGSLGEDNSKSAVSDVTVSHSWFKRTQNGARIKTWQGGSGYVKNVIFQHLTMDAVDHPIVIDQYYCNGKLNCGTKDSGVQISDVKFIDIHGSSTQDEPINLACSKTVPCTDITIEDVQITANGKNAMSYCLNAHGTARDVSPSVSCLN